MLSEFQVLSTSGDGKTPIKTTQEEVKTMLEALVLVLTKAFMDKNKIMVRVVFDHDKNRFRIDAKDLKPFEVKKDESRIINPYA